MAAALGREFAIRASMPLIAHDEYDDSGKVPPKGDRSPDDARIDVSAGQRIDVGAGQRGDTKQTALPTAAKSVIVTDAVASETTAIPSTEAASTEGEVPSISNQLSSDGGLSLDNDAAATAPVFAVTRDQPASSPPTVGDKYQRVEPAASGVALSDAEDDALRCLRCVIATNLTALPTSGSDGGSLRAAASALLASVQATLDAQQCNR